MTEYLNTETPSDDETPTFSAKRNANGDGQILTNLTHQSIVAEEKTVHLLEERLLIDQHKRKVGEVIVRKEIETEMIQVPVRREKLIVEQISPEHQQLAEIDLGAGEITGVELTTSEKSELAGFDSGFVVSGEFISPKIASLILNAIALERHHGCERIKIAISVENEVQQQKYQEWFNRCSINQQS